VPGERMKAGREYHVPLSPRVIPILRAVEPLETYKGKLTNYDFSTITIEDYGKTILALRSE
jgi:hypothetical protein